MIDTFDSHQLALSAETWLPRLAVAAIILVAAWLIAGIARSLLAKGIDRVPLATRHNQARPNDTTLGANLGQVAYWLVLLFGIIAALNVLQLNQVASPLNLMLTEFLGYIPNLVGAGLIFFVGFVVATIARRLVVAAMQAANLEAVLSRLGIAGASSTTLPNVAGTVVFVLIIVPVSIAALQALQIAAISGPAIAVLSVILAAVPNVVAAGIVLAIGVMIGRWIGGVVERLLPATGIDALFGSMRALSSYDSNAGQASFAQPSPATPPPPPGPSASKIIGGLVTFAVILFTAVEAARLLHFAIVAVIIAQILALGGRVILGAAIIAAGVVIADLVANAMRRSMSAGDKFAASLAKWATIALAVAMGLRSMGIADEIVTLAFGLILGSAAVAAALAFGLGGRTAAARLAEHWVDRAQKKPPETP
jgi:hypothetical protein